MSDNIRCCSSCGTSGGNELLQCSACHLAFYCSKACQKAEWKTHKKLCKIAQVIPTDTTKLELNPEKVSDFDSALEYAAEYLTQLKYVELRIPQEYVLSFYNNRNPDGVNLSARGLESFLSRRKLKSFKFYFGECCWEHTRRMTNSGKAFRPLANHDELERFTVMYAVFDRAEDLVNCLPLNLKTLELPYLTLGSELQPWPRSATGSLVSAVSDQNRLVKLCLSDCHFFDSDLEGLLSGLSNLRSLKLEGAFGDRDGSNLTNAGFAVIARCCPQLQALDLNYHYRATTAGVQTILSSCQHLRELHVARAQIQPQEVKNLLLLSRKLLLFCSGLHHLPRLMSESEISFLREAIIATKGRTLLIQEYEGLVQVSGLPAGCREEAARSKQLVEDASEKLNDPEIHNEWADLF